MSAWFTFHEKRFRSVAMIGCIGSWVVFGYAMLLVQGAVDWPGLIVSAIVVTALVCL